MADAEHVIPPDRWQRVKAVFHGARERGVADRAAYLDTACEGDPVLRAEVDSLLGAYERNQEFIEVPALAGGLQVEGDGETAEPLEGVHLGPYRLLDQIGEGGMGTVYRAVRADDRYEKQVAIKLVRHGLDSPQALDRFRNECRILARLEHPGIARILDAGTAPDGRPYVVMELVQGRRIDRYADEEALDTRGRLTLFRSVCAAVHYAHQNLVVHRDIKPSNILVTHDGAPKLLDFGIAKLLDADAPAEATATLARMLTPEYASPEQVRGEPATTVTDVYLLGVLLYELLTGRRPFTADRRAPQELARMICEQEPERPSVVVSRSRTDTVGNDSPTLKLRRDLAGDVDTIVLKSLRKEPARRYSSVEAFSEDVRRSLEGRPVLARPDTFAYRAGKFVRRNLPSVSLAALVVVVSLAGAAATVWQARRAEAERARAERRFEDVRRLAQSFLFEIHDGIEKLPGSTPARRLVVKKALEYLDSLAHESRNDPALQRDLAAAYLKVGDVQGRPGAANVGDLTGARRSYEQSLAIRRRLVLDAPADATLQLAMAESHGRLGEVLAKSGRLATALEHHDRARGIAAAVAAADPSNTRATLALCLAEIETSGLLARAGGHAQARERLEQALHRAEVLLASPAQDRDTRLVLADLVPRLGHGFRTVGSTKQAVDLHRRTVTLLEELTAAEPGHAGHRRRLGVAHQGLGDALLFSGALQEAVARYREALLLFETQSAQDPANAEARRDIAVVHLRLGQAFRLTERGGDEALEQYRRALAVSTSLSAADPANQEVVRDIRFAHSGIGLILVGRKDFAGALAAFRAAAARAEALSKGDPENQQLRQDLVGSYNDLGKALEWSGDLAPAVKMFQEALSLGQVMAEADPENRGLQQELSFTHGRLGDVLLKSRELAGAVEHYRRAIEASAALAAGAGPASPAREFVAWWERKHGDALATRAAAGDTSPARWREAREAYRRAARILGEIQAVRPLSSYAAEEPARLKKQIARCDAVLGPDGGR